MFQSYTTHLNSFVLILLTSQDLQTSINQSKSKKVRQVVEVNLPLYAFTSIALSEPIFNNMSKPEIPSLR